MPVTPKHNWGDMPERVLNMMYDGASLKDVINVMTEADLSGVLSGETTQLQWYIDAFTKENQMRTCAEAQAFDDASERLLQEVFGHYGLPMASSRRTARFFAFTLHGAAAEAVIGNDGYYYLLDTAVEARLAWLGQLGS